MTLYQSMSRSWIRFLGACVFVLLSTPVPTGAQVMGRVYVVKSDPSNPASVFAAAQQGVFKSTDAGATWTATSLTQPTLALAIAPVTPTTVYAGTDLGLFESTDGGTTWSPAGVSNPVSSVEIDPAIPTTLYASIGSQIIKSADGGANWTSVGPAGFVAIVASPPLTLYVGSKSMGGIDVASSIDGGSTWITASVSNPDPGFSPLWVLDFALTINPTIATTAYVASSGYRCDGDGCFTIGAISQSTDGGATWFAVDQVLGYYGSWVWPQIGVSQVVVDPLQSNIFYAAWNVFCDQQDPFCAGFGIVSDAWISKYGGATGPRISDLSAWALWFDLLNPTVLFAATASGVLQSTDGGVTWNSGDSQPPPPPPPADTTPPDTSITSARDGSGTTLANYGVTLSTSLILSFAGTDDLGLSRLECQLDGAGFSACTSPLTHSTLSLGLHIFEVRAVDTSGNVDPTPARYTWTVDAAPETTINGAVDGRGKSVANGGSTPSDKVTLRFTGTDNGTVARFECRLDATAFTSCTSPVTYGAVSRGAHTVRVRAVDNNGFADPSPAVFNWTR